MKWYWVRLFFVCFVGCSLSLFSNENDEEIRGITIVPHSSNKIEGTEGIHLFHSSLSSSNQNELSKSLAQCFLGKKLSVGLLRDIKNDIYSFYSEKGKPFVVVRILEQEITNGIIVIEVNESKLGNVSVEGARWFSSESYRSALRLKEQCSLSTTVMQEDLSWINRNPFRSAEVICKRGKETMTTDVDLIVKDQFPLRGFVGTDNTGFKETGYQRAFAGVYIGNLFSLGQTFSYQYTMNYDPKSFQSHIASYDIPFSWRHLLSFFGGASFVRDSLESSETLRSHGDSFQASGRYTIPFFQGGRFPQEIRFGCDFKRLNNNIIFGGQTVSAKNLNIFQFLLEYKLLFSSPNSRHDFSLEAVLSPGPLLPDMTSADFNLLRPGAGPNYFYVRGGLKQLYSLPKNYTLCLDWAFQLSTNKLIASEQFGLGGYTTVRGYQERAINADNTFLLRIEPRFPSISFPKMGSLVFFCFTDIGVGVDQLKLAANYRNTQALCGIGPGFRYHYKKNIALRFDWGYQLTNIQNNPAGHNRINFGATLTL